MKYGPQLHFSDHLHAEKYRLPGESYLNKCVRVAQILGEGPAHYNDYLGITLAMRFLEAGRVQAAIGSPKRVTAFNCFVSGTVEDSFVDGEGSIMQRATETAQTMRMGGGIGTDFSTLRPLGDIIKGVNARTGGPMAFLPIWDAICKATSSAGNRRGALMGVLRVDHPDIELFIEAKQTPGALTGFNLSIAVTNEFMAAVSKGSAFKLQFGGQVYKEVDAAELWEKIMRLTWDWAEPGVLFIDTINQMNNLWYCETIAATNPCGEQPLPPNGACLLGSYNLTKYMQQSGSEFYFDWALFRRDIPIVTRAMDNIFDNTIYPLPIQEAEAKNKRRMGIGITGLANAAEALGFPYGSPGFLEFQQTVSHILANETYRASAMLAKEKGAFPLYDAESYLQGKFIRTLDPDVWYLIAQHGIRNSHLLSIAPTGTISFAADYVSSGIEPVFSYGGKRKVIMPEGEQIVDVSDYGHRVFGVKGKLAENVTAQEHIDVLAMASAYVDSAVSKTCNVSPSMPWEDFKNLYYQAWERGCKGCTTFNPGGKRMGILMGDTPKKEEAGEACYIDPATGQKECS